MQCSETVTDGCSSCRRDSPLLNLHNVSLQQHSDVNVHNIDINIMKVCTSWLPMSPSTGQCMADYCRLGWWSLTHRTNHTECAGLHECDICSPTCRVSTTWNWLKQCCCGAVSCITRKCMSTMLCQCGRPGQPHLQVHCMHYNRLSI